MSESVMATPFVEFGWVRASNFLMNGVASLFVKNTSSGVPVLGLVGRGGKVPSRFFLEDAVVVKTVCEPVQGVLERFIGFVCTAIGKTVKLFRRICAGRLLQVQCIQRSAHGVAECLYGQYLAHGVLHGGSLLKQ